MLNTSASGSDGIDDFLWVTPCPLRVIWQTWQVSLSFGILYWVYKYLLEWPASWIILVLLLRAILQFALYAKNLHLVLEGDILTGPNWSMSSRCGVSVSRLMLKKKVLGRIFLEDSEGNAITFRPNWYLPDEFKKLDQLIQQRRLSACPPATEYGAQTSDKAAI